MRERVVQALDGLVPELMVAIQRQLESQTEPSARPASMAELHLALDTQAAFQRQREAWVAAVRQGWKQVWSDALKPGAAAASEPAGLGLVDDEVVERKIIASRLGAAVQDQSGGEFNNLRLRAQALERSRDLSSHDVLRPEVFAQQLIKAWGACGLTRPMWSLAQPAVQEALVTRLGKLYAQANAWLIEQGVMPEIDFKSMVRRADGSTPESVRDQTPDEDVHDAPAHNASRAGGAAGGSASTAYPQGSRFANEGGGRGAFSAGYGAGASAGVGRTGDGGGMGAYPGGRGAAAGAGGFVGRGGGGRFGSSGGMPVRAGGAQVRGMTDMGAGVSLYTEPGAPVSTVHHTALARAAQETRMMTGITPMARVRQRAQGVIGQLRRLLSDRVADFDVAAAPGQAGAPSPQLAQALAEQQATAFAVTELLTSRPGEPTAVLSTADVAAVATQLRQRASALKAKAEKPSEKATIEIVALMFQAILAEERIPANIRVWFARLQIPVLRLALAEPDFFASVEHPARQLIDRMGACALGFDANQINGSRLEREIKRIVQVIEQYPETGRRVYQLVLDEFKRFLGRSLTEGGAVQQAATLAQQVEQKEALAIQYTIELRRMLDQVPVADEVREFLFRIWSEVLAIAAVRRGPQDAETLRYKQAAADLLWAVSPKTDRAERSRVVQRLSSLLHVLREGMAMLAMPQDEQDAQIKQINDAVTRAFVSRDEGISEAKLTELSRSLAALEDVVTDDAEGDVLLDPAMIEMMFGVDSESLEVISSGGSIPSEAVLQWAHELELGNWFALDYQGRVSQVQYVWCSRRGQLHLFAASHGKSYLVQTTRMASYLQAGLLVQLEDEALTVRATRAALAKLNAEPDRLVQ